MKKKKIKLSLKKTVVVRLNDELTRNIKGGSGGCQVQGAKPKPLTKDAKDTACWSSPLNTGGWC